MFYARSPRNILPDEARALAGKARGQAKVVALFVDPDDELLAEVIEAVAPDIVQLHGSETPARVAEIAQRFGRPVMKAVTVAGAADVQTALAYEGKADRILFDARAPMDDADALPGGNGVAFDWQALSNSKGVSTYMLAGGLTPVKRRRGDPFHRRARCRRFLGC